MAVVPPEEEVQRPGESRDECDVREWAADEVVAALRRPVEDVVHRGREEHAASLLGFYGYPTIVARARAARTAWVRVEMSYAP